MATAKTTRKQAAAPRRQRATPIETPPSPPGMAKKATDTEGNVQDISGDSSIRPGVDPRGSAADTGPHDNEGNQQIDGGGYTDTAGALHAAPPTPTVESAATANDAPGEGSSTGQSRPRRVLDDAADEVEVEGITRDFILTDAKGEHHYGPTTTKMPREHVSHWYAKNFGVKQK